MCQRCLVPLLEANVNVDVDVVVEVVEDVVVVVVLDGDGDGDDPDRRNTRGLGGLALTRSPSCFTGP